MIVEYVWLAVDPAAIMYITAIHELWHLLRGDVMTLQDINQRNN